MVLVALAIGLAAVLVGTAVAVWRGISFGRTSRRVGSALTDSVGALAAGGDRLEANLGALEGATRELEAARLRLHLSLARLRVQRESVDKALERARWLTVFLPR